MGFWDKLFGGSGTKSSPKSVGPAEPVRPALNPSVRVRMPSTKGLSQEQKKLLWNGTLRRSERSSPPLPSGTASESLT
jgi:hypothetical protein